MQSGVICENLLSYQWCVVDCHWISILFLFGPYFLNKYISRGSLDESVEVLPSFSAAKATIISYNGLATDHIIESLAKSEFESDIT